MCAGAFEPSTKGNGPLPLLFSQQAQDLLEEPGLRAWSYSHLSVLVLTQGLAMVGA